jgi:hypothetical protein
MNVSEIIAEIAALPPEQQQQIIRFTRRLDEQGQLSPPELGSLARKLSDCADEREANALKQKITNGFYGGARRA